MSSYRIARRSFIRSVGAGAVGLKIMLRNLEASAQGAKSPPRFLLTHWPVGTQKYWFVPVAVGSNPNPALPALPTPAPNGTNWDVSRILKPFGDAGLKNDMIVLYGLNSGSVGRFGGGHEAGTPQSTTGASTPGTRANGGETDDAVSGGPSWDQIFLKLVPDLYRPNSGVGYVNAICDARVDSQETSTQCLSYDYRTQSTPAAQGGTGGSVVENAPLTPILSPIQLYNKLFMNIGGGGSVNDTLRLLKARKSVLDSAAAQLTRLRTVAPGSESSKIDQHADAIRKIELMLSDQITQGTPTTATCTPPMMPDPALSGKNTRINNDYRTVGAGPTTASTDDSVIHQQIGMAHMGIIRTAFQCDLLRVATFQWSPGTNHVSFKGLYPGNTNIYMHHPTSHQINVSEWSLQSPSFVPGGGGAISATQQEILNFLANVQTWYNQRMAEILTAFKGTTDVLGGNLLDNTIIPYITEVAETNHSKSQLPAVIFGGRALGMKGGQFQSVSRPHNDLWLTIAQAYFKTTNPIASLPPTNADGTANTFVRTNTSPIAGLWAPP
jgi:hypothetical protein